MKIVDYRVDVLADEDADFPWENEDGHGAVSEWEARNKVAGELVLATYRSFSRFYDFADACKKARLEHWGSSRATGDESAKQLATMAAWDDYMRLKAWCDGAWWYCGVAVTEIREDGDGIRYDGKSASLWGIESDSGAAHFDEVRDDLIKELGS